MSAYFVISVIVWPRTVVAECGGGGELSVDFGKFLSKVLPAYLF